MSNKIGTFSHKVNAAKTYLELSKSDERAAILLAEHREYRQACYFLIQSMEKLLRSEIFTRINPNNPHFRDMNKSHSVEKAADLLIEIVSTNETVKSQVSRQLKDYVLGKTNYSYLHNNLRYPTYFNKFDSYSILSVEKSDFIALSNSLELLKKFLADLHQIS